MANKDLEGPNLVDLEDDESPDAQRKALFRLPGFDLISALKPTSQAVSPPLQDSSSQSQANQASGSLPALQKAHPINASEGKPKSSNVPKYSIADGLFQVQAQLQQSLSSMPVALTNENTQHNDTSTETTSTKSGRQSTQLTVPLNQYTSSLSNAESFKGVHGNNDQNKILPEDNNEAIHLMHSEKQKNKRNNGGGNLSRISSHFRRNSISSNNSADSLAPLVTGKMLENPVLSDLSLYDGRSCKNTALSYQQQMQLRSNREQIQRLYNHADLLTRQIYQINETADNLKHNEKAVHVLIENQRGWFILGFPFFSSNMLVPTDPKSWTCGATGRPAPGDISSYPLPDPTWDWTWSRWYVDMAYDVDDQGWSYSWRFRSDTWHGSHVWFHSFVRRRRWIRVCHRNVSTPPASKLGITSELNSAPLHHSVGVAVSSTPTMPASTGSSGAHQGPMMVPMRSTSPTSSIRSAVSSIMDTPRHEYRDRTRTEAAQSYGNKYFVVPSTGRITASLGSPRRQAGSGPSGTPSQRYSLNSVPTSNLSNQINSSSAYANQQIQMLRSPSSKKRGSMDLHDDTSFKSENNKKDKTLIKLRGHLFDAGVVDADRPNFHILNEQKHEDDPFHIHALPSSSHTHLFEGEDAMNGLGLMPESYRVKSATTSLNANSTEKPFTLSDLILDLDSARIDRERLEIFTAFVADPCNLYALAAANNHNHSEEREKDDEHLIDWSKRKIQVGNQQIHYIRRILSTFTHLDSKIHLLEHLKEVIEIWKGKLQGIKDLKNDIQSAGRGQNGEQDGEYRDDGDDLELRKNDIKQLERQERYLIKYLNELGMMQNVMCQIVGQQQYYNELGDS